jgi:hypothetical protein
LRGVDAGVAEKIPTELSAEGAGRGLGDGRFHAGDLTLQTCNIEVPDLTGFPECVKYHPL